MEAQRRVAFIEIAGGNERLFEVSFIENQSEKYCVRNTMGETLLDLARYWLEHDDYMFRDLYNED